MKVMPPSTALRTMRMLSFSSTFLRPRCQPPRPIADTCSPVRPRILSGTFLFASACGMSHPRYGRPGPVGSASTSALRLRRRLFRNLDRRSETLSFKKGAARQNGAGARIAGSEHAKHVDGNLLPSASDREEDDTAGARIVALSDSDFQLHPARGGIAAVHDNRHQNGDITRIERRLLLDADGRRVGEQDSPQREHKDDNHRKDSAKHVRPSIWS